MRRKRIRRAYWRTLGRFFTLLTRETVVMTYNLPFWPGATAVRRRQRWRTRLGVPRHKSVLGCTAYRQRVDTVSVSITVAAVSVPATITRRPYKDRTQPIAALRNKQ